MRKIGQAVHGVGVPVSQRHGSVQALVVVCLARHARMARRVLMSHRTEAAADVITAAAAGRQRPWAAR